MDSFASVSAQTHCRPFVVKCDLTPCLVCVAAWIDSLQQTKFLDKAFGIVPTDYPQLIVLSGRKNRSETVPPVVGSCSRLPLRV